MLRTASASPRPPKVRTPEGAANIFPKGSYRFLQGSISILARFPNLSQQISQRFQSQRMTSSSVCCPRPAFAAEAGQQKCKSLLRWTPRGMPEHPMAAEVGPNGPEVVQKDPQGPQGAPKDWERLLKNIPKSTQDPPRARKKSAHLSSSNLCTGSLFLEMPS